MPWCPKCKTEYIEGIEFCADCHTPLVDSLEEPLSDEDNYEAQTENTIDDRTQKDMSQLPSEDDAEAETEEPGEDIEKMARELHKHTNTYVKPEEQYKDTRSSGYMLIFIGAAGLIVLVLIALKIIPVALDPVMQYIFYGVLAVLFLVFLVLGINAVRKSGEYKAKIGEAAGMAGRSCSERTP